jgi:hypothetical protein
MAVRAHWAKVCDWIYDVLPADLGQWAKMMDVDISFGDFSICGAKAETADGATGAVRSDASPPSLCVSLVGVDRHPANGSFRKRCYCRSDLLGKEQGRAINPVELFERFGDLRPHYPVPFTLALLEPDQSPEPFRLRVVLELLSH